MNTTLLNVTRLNVTELNTTRINTEGVTVGKRPDDIHKAIMDSMVLWYDIARQGCTNETMAVNPVLRDLSGNGHDATCRNFAWSGMSGIGGYDDGKYPPISLFNKIDVRGTVKVSDRYSITITSVLQAANSSNYNFDIVHNVLADLNCKYKITGLQEGQKIFVGRDSHSVANVVSRDGIYTPSGIFNEETGKYTVGFGAVDFLGECNITIEQIPEYPNALVADGVDDYVFVEGLPLLTKEKGYTIIAKRKWLDISTTSNKLDALASKRDLSSGIDGAFQFEYTNAAQLSVNFGASANIQFTEEDFSYQTSKVYNDVGIKIGDGADSDLMLLFASYEGHSHKTHAVLYQFLLFDRDLSDQEIQWVKMNLMTNE